jgi:hypothetical protein
LQSNVKLAGDPRKPGRRRESDRPTKRLCRFGLCLFLVEAVLERRLMRVDSEAQ